MRPLGQGKEGGKSYRCIHSKMTKEDLHTALTWNYNGKKPGVVVTIKQRESPETDHAIVVDSIKEGRVHIRDPFDQKLTYSIKWDDFAEV